MRFVNFIFRDGEQGKSRDEKRKEGKRMVDILINLREREEKIKKGQKVMVQIKSYFRKNFKCEIRDYDGMNYRIRFSEKGQIILTEDIPRKRIDDWSLDKKPHFDYWKELFGRVEKELERPKGDELFSL